MNRDGLLVLYDYNAYANGLLLDTVAQLTEAKFLQVSSPSHGSVHELLVHMLEGEAFFLSVCTGYPLDELPSLPALADIHHAWAQLAKEIHNYLVSLTDADLAQEIEVPLKGQSLHFPKWQALVQGFVHSTHHRGELSIVLTELGCPLPTLDILLQFIKQSGQPWP